MIALGTLALILIAVGIAAPQLVYLEEANRYDEFVAEATALRTEVSETEVDLAATEVLLHLLEEESRGIATRLELLAAASADVLPEAQTVSLGAAAAGIAAALPAAPKEVPGTLLRNVERATQQDPASAPVSWFAVSPMVAAQLADIGIETPEPVEVEKTVTRDAVDRVKRQIAADRRTLEDLDEQLAERTVALEDLQDEVTDQLAVVDDIAAGAPELAAKVVTDYAAPYPGGLPVETRGVVAEDGTPQPSAFEQFNGDMSAAAGAASTAAGSDEFVRLPDATVVPAVEVADSAEKGTPVSLEPAVRSLLVLHRLEVFVHATAAVLEEQERLGVPEDDGAASPGDTPAGGPQQPQPPTQPELPAPPPNEDPPPVEPEAPSEADAGGNG